MSKCKPSLCVITGDVIARSSSWWSKDISTTEGLKLFSLPPTIQRLIWDFEKANSKNIRKALDLVNWERLFDRKDINAQVTIFN